MKNICQIVIGLLIISQGAQASLYCLDVPVELTSHLQIQTLKAQHGDVERGTQVAIDELDFQAFRQDRTLSPEESTYRAELRARQTDCRDKFIELSYKILRLMNEGKYPNWHIQKQ